MHWRNRELSFDAKHNIFSFENGNQLYVRSTIELINNKLALHDTGQDSPFFSVRYNDINE